MKQHRKTPNTKHQKPILGNGERVNKPTAYPEPSVRYLLLNEEPQRAPVRRAFDLEERTAVFGERVVRFSKKIPRNPTNNRLIDQLVGCGTSVAANYVEANASVSRRDFRFTISRCLKEAKETKLFLRMVAASERELVSEARELYREANELQLIFASLFRKNG